METALFLALLAAATALLAARRDGPGLGLAGLVAGLAILGGWLWQPGGDPVLDRGVPAKRDDGGFATSDSCRACHPGAYAAWHGSFHRTMTQRATPASVLGDFDGVALTSRGHRTRLERLGEEFWADLPDPLWFVDASPDKPATPPRIRVRVVMTTGSHHLQNYWIRRPSSGDLYRDVPDNGALVQLPWVWDVADARWLPVQDSFLAPPSDTTLPPEVWNSSCHACHSVGTQPRLAGEDFATHSVELGIACEACHGPAAEHIEANGSPWRRYLQHFSKDGDPTIVNPTHLEAPRAAEVCGQCHSFSHERDPMRIRQTGPAFRPGDVLAETRAIFRYDEHPRPAVLEEYLARDPGVLESAFWADGTMRVAGREYNGLIESACYQRGELTCISCHSMHGYREPSDQLKAGQDDDHSCVECHRGIATRVAEHSHHAPDSSGSRCVNCHMPHTSFGLFVAMRSHRVDNPSAARSAETGRPNACNLCHLDQTLGWAAGYLSEWYGQPPATLDPRQRELAAGPLWAVRGDAAQRAIAAWHMGWAPAQQASGRKWMGAYLAVLLADPYPVVRRVAERALTSHQGFEGFAFDFVAAPDELTRKLTAAAGRWSRAMAGRPDRSGPELLLDARGELDEPALRSLLAERDNTPVRIVE